MDITMDLTVELGRTMMQVKEINVLDEGTIVELDNSDKENIKAIIDLNKNHEVYKGHFPNNPVVPEFALLN